MAKLDPRIDVIRQTYGLDVSDFWELPQKKGTWVATTKPVSIVSLKGFRQQSEVPRFPVRGRYFNGADMADWKITSVKDITP